MSYADGWSKLPPSPPGMFDGGEQEFVKPNVQHGERRSRKLLLSLSLCTLVFTCLIVGLTSEAYLRAIQKLGIHGPVKHSNVCNYPVLRREWRSLSRAEKRDYIQSVKCLKTLPSRLQLNQTLYDDFSWVHKHFGEYSHDAAPFLAWHRYFIHTYERTLRKQCGYQGQLTYWDWTLDWENVTMSPVWDIKTGFGGNGNVGVGSPVFKAHCVTEGPFANLEVPYYEDIYEPHCLLRGFDENLEDFRLELHPETLMKLLLSPDYRSINLGLEHGPHVAIPKSINGDFSIHTAPFGKRRRCSTQMRYGLISSTDPVFFLHHTQLDRMWWQWQQIDLAKRATEYMGKAATDSNDKASLEDSMPMGGLASDIKVLEIMSTESDLLCYRY